MEVRLTCRGAQGFLVIKCREGDLQELSISKTLDPDPEVGKIIQRTSKHFVLATLCSSLKPLAGEALLIYIVGSESNSFAYTIFCSI